jgi:CubicO group peptidase (beta-lactamase class C family)
VDYAHLCRMILNWGNYDNKRILSRKTVEQMCSDQLFGNPGDYMFGLGLEITTEEMAIRSMKSIGSLRWGGLFGTEYLIDPKEELIILFYTNRVSWYPNTVYDDFVRLVYMSLY